jgi:hypothetical protein
VIKDNSEVHALRHCGCSFVLIGLRETEREVVVAWQLATEQLGVVVELNERIPFHDVAVVATLD